MSDTPFLVSHVSVIADQLFERVAQALAQQRGRLDPAVDNSRAGNTDPEGARATIQAMTGPSGFMLCNTFNHGWLPWHILGQGQKVMVYVIGDPWLALELKQGDIRAALYAPLRLLHYENAEGKTGLEDDRPSSIFGQFGNARINAFAAELDRKLEALLATVTKSLRRKASMLGTSMANRLDRQRRFT
jgi:hypothetical protein